VVLVRRPNDHELLLAPRLRMPGLNLGDVGCRAGHPHCCEPDICLTNAFDILFLGSRPSLESPKARQYTQVRQPMAHPADPETELPELPPLPRVVANFAGSVVRNTVAAVQGRLRVGATEARRRAAACRGCPFFRSVDARCAHMACGCYLRVKVWLAAERCPAGKW